MLKFSFYLQIRNKSLVNIILHLMGGVDLMVRLLKLISNGPGFSPGRGTNCVVGQGALFHSALIGVSMVSAGKFNAGSANTCHHWWTNIPPSGGVEVPLVKL